MFTQTAIALLLVMMLSSPKLQAQAAYTFKNATLVSGTALTTGAVYKFPLVKPGVDARVTITAVTGGITLTSIDENWTGFDEAFQPFINVASNSNGYVEFNIDFVVTGSTIPSIQAVVPATCVDVDGVDYGNGKLYEKDQVQFVAGYYDFSMTGSNLQVLNPAGWVTIKNTSAASYAGIDTVAKDVMATVVNLGISSFKVRIGGMNTSPTNSEVRYRSVYFKTFKYPNSILLPNRTLIHFSGMVKGKTVELKGTLSASHTYDRLIIERGSSASSLQKIGEIDISGTASAAYSWTYLDNTPGDLDFYRIRLVNSSNGIFELSNTLMIRVKEEDEKGFTFRNTMLNVNDPAIIITSNIEAPLALQLYDMNGRMVYQRSTHLSSGTNSVDLSNFNTTRGYYVLVAKTDTKTITEKVILQ